jgi:trk system potassium uptake protein TrkA
LALARRLAAAELRVVLIEESEERARVAVDTLSGVLVIRGSATDKALLDDEEIERFSAFVAVTPDHEANLVAGLLAKRLGVDRSMALVDNPALVDLVGDIGVDAIISQRLLTIGLVLQHIRGGEIRSGAALLGDEVEIIEVEVVEGSGLTAGPLIELGLPRGVLVAARRRGGELLVPQGKDSIAPGDQVLIISKAGMGPKLTEFLEG